MCTKEVDCVDTSLLSVTVNTQTALTCDTLQSKTVSFKTIGFPTLCFHASNCFFFYVLF